MPASAEAFSPSFLKGKTYDGAGALSLGSDPGGMTARRKTDFAVSENTYLCFGYGHCTAGELNVCLASADGTESVSRAAIAAYGWWKPRTIHVLTGFAPRLAAGTKVASLRLSFAKAGGAIIVDNVTLLEAHDLYALGELMPAPCQVKNPLKIALPEDLKHPVASNYWVRRCMYGRRGKPPPADEVVKRADEFLDRHDGEEIQIPRGIRECGVADGKCPAHADVALSFDPAKPGRLHCPECKKDYEGGQYHNAWKKQYCEHLSDVFRDLVNAHGHTRDLKYARAAKEIIDAFAEDVHWSVQSKNMGTPYWEPGGYWYFFYDRIAGSEAFSRADRKTIGHRLLAQKWMGSKGGLLSNYAGRGNTVEFFNSLIGHRPERLDHLINNKIGRMVEEGTSDEGLWIQNSPAYHQFFFNYYITLAETCRRLKLGIDLYNHNFGTKSFRNLFEIYLPATMPDGKIPAVNDNRARRRGLSARAKIDQAYRIYGDEEFKWDSRKLLPSVHLPSTGWAILRSEAATREEQTYLMLTYQRGTKDGHKHEDWFQIILYANGDYVSPDLDVPDYGGLGYGNYYRAPTSHNTVLANGHASARAGQPVFFKDGRRLKVVDVVCERDGSENRRTVCMEANGNYIVDLYWVRSDTAETYDWLYHTWGKMGISLPMEPAERLAGGYFACISDVESAVTDGVWTAAWDLSAGTEAEKIVATGTSEQKILPKPGVPAADSEEEIPKEFDAGDREKEKRKTPPVRKRWTLPLAAADSGKHVRPTMLPARRTLVHAAKGLGYTTDERIPMTIVRRPNVSRTLYASVIEPVKARRKVKRIGYAEPKDFTEAFFVETDDGVDYYLAPHGRPFVWQEHSISIDGDIGVVTTRHGRVMDLLLLRGTSLRTSELGIQCEKQMVAHLSRTDQGYDLENQSDERGRITLSLKPFSRAMVCPKEAPGEPIAEVTSAAKLSFVAHARSEYRVNVDRRKE